VLRYLLMPGPSPTPRPRAKARPIPTANTTTKTVLRRLGLGRASGLAPRSMIIVFAPSLRVAATANVWGSKGGERRAQGGLSVGIAYVIGLVNANIAREGLEQIGFPRATKPPLSDELVPC
jgi:hypothetical protein